jgi:rSAM/selenodomain-associated transferase 2
MATSTREDTLSIVIPVLNEGPRLERLLSSLAEHCADAETIVVDGGSTDDTRLVVSRFPSARLVVSPRGRARQMNAGAREARGGVFLFLHADTSLPHDALEAIQAAMADPQTVGGRFDVRFDSSRAIFRIIAYLINLRSRLSRITTGDQALFVRRTTFTALGGYPDMPLMEDVEFSKRLKRRGRIACLRLCVTTAARKWEHHGTLRTVLLMWRLRLLYFLGVSPARLHRSYYGIPPPPE